MEQIAEIGKIAGLAGIALGVLLVIFRDAVAPQIPNLSKQQAYALLRTMVVLTFAVGVIGIGVWGWVETHPKPDLAAESREECLAAVVAAQERGAGASSGVISAGGDVAADGNIQVEGADQLDRPAVSADCGNVTAGGSIGIEAGSEHAEPAQAPQ